MKKLLILTGELSGFIYAREIVGELSPFFEIFGVFTEEVPGSRRILDSKELTAFGLFEVISKLPNILRGKRKIVSFLESEKPDAVLLIDFPGFNLQIAKEAKKRGIKVLYFIPPKVWAWGRRRVEKLRAYCDRIFVIFPFEVPFYSQFGIDVTYVGNPLVDMVKPNRKRREFLETFEIEEPFYALLPGSRPSEVKYLLPTLKEFSESFGGNWVIPVADTVKELFKDFQSKNVKLVPESERYNVLRYSEAGVIASGTASLEAAISELPHVVVYRVHPLTYFIAKRAAKLPFVSLPNLIAGKEVVPELLQDRFNRENLFMTFETLLENRDWYREVLKREVKEKLSGGAVKKLSEEIKREI
jgi:lipid-A-disaccharide synthase